MRRRDVSLSFDRLAALPEVCVRHGKPARLTVQKTFRTPRTGRWWLRAYWPVSLLYRRRKRVTLPVCIRCFVLYQVARVVFWTTVAMGAYLVATASPAQPQKTGGWDTADYAIATLTGLLVFSAWWLWHRPVDGERMSGTVRLIKTAEPFAVAVVESSSAFLVGEANPQFLTGSGDPRFTWPGAGENPAGTSVTRW